MSDFLATLIQAVETADSADLLLEAVEDLAAVQDEGAIPTLIATLSYNNPGAAVAAVDGLIQLGEPAVPTLLTQLDGTNYTARAWAIRALAGIGDPRGLPVLLESAKTDIGMSVRRAATLGLGTLHWEWFPPSSLFVAQEKALTALLQIVEQDEEWVVRYAAVVGLERLFPAIDLEQVGWRSQVTDQLETRSLEEKSLAVRARVWMAQHRLKNEEHYSHSTQTTTASTQIPVIDWSQLLTQLQSV